MIWLWIILIVLTILNIVWIAHSLIDDLSVFISVMVLFFGVGLCGWGLIGVSTTFHKKDVQCSNLEIIKTSRRIIVFNLDENKYYYFDNKIDYENISDTTKFFSKQGTNIYGITITQNFFYYIYNDTIPVLDTFNIVGKERRDSAKL